MTRTRVPSRRSSRRFRVVLPRSAGRSSHTRTRSRPGGRLLADSARLLAGGAAGQQKAAGRQREPGEEREERYAPGCWEGALLGGPGCVDGCVAYSSGDFSVGLVYRAVFVDVLAVFGSRAIARVGRRGLRGETFTVGAGLRRISFAVLGDGVGGADGGILVERPGVRVENLGSIVEPDIFEGDGLICGHLQGVAVGAAVLAGR